MAQEVQKKAFPVSGTGICFPGQMRQNRNLKPSPGSVFMRFGCVLVAIVICGNKDKKPAPCIIPPP
jgi:hypothetical protein